MALNSISVSGVTSIIAASASANVELPTSGSPTTALITNLGTNVAYVLLGSSSVVVSPATGVPVLPGQSIALTISSNTYLAAIASYPVPLNVTVGS